MASQLILLVDDSSTTRKMLGVMLKDEGYDVRTADDGADGLVKAREQPRPDLILTDYEMPELDGAGLCRAIKADDALRSIPVIVLTSHDMLDDLDAGADAYIQKPANPDAVQAMFACIRTHLRIDE